MAADKVHRLLIQGGRIVNPDREFDGDVLVEDGIITEVGSEWRFKRQNQIAQWIQNNEIEIVDAHGKLVIPGGIDPHTHCQLPFMGTVAVDDFAAGTRAALAGGTTMLIDFVLPPAGESLTAAFEQWKAWADPKVHCDYGLHVAVTSWRDDATRAEMTELAQRRGVSSFKMFMAYKGAFMLDDAAMLLAMQHCRALGALAQVHAENGDLVHSGAARMFALGITGPEGHALSRPEEVEGEATARACVIAETARCPLYVVHVMSKSAAKAVRRARKRGVRVFGEPIAAGLGVDGRKCWHEDWRVAAAYVMGPPLRPDPTVKTFLMQMLASGDLHTVGTDNCTFNAEQKALGKDDFRRIPNGVNGIEDRMSVVWDKGVAAGLLTPSQFVAVTSTNVAKIFNCYPRKGLVAVGSDADLVVWDPAAKRTISAKTHHHACDFNIFEGMEVQGVAHTTISRGVVRWHDGKFVSLVPGAGRYVPRPTGGFAYDGIEGYDAARCELKQKVERLPYQGPVIQL